MNSFLHNLTFLEIISKLYVEIRYIMDLVLQGMSSLIPRHDTKIQQNKPK